MPRLSVCLFVCSGWLSVWAGSCDPPVIQKAMARATAMTSARARIMVAAAMAMERFMSRGNCKGNTKASPMGRGGGADGRNDGEREEVEARVMETKREIRLCAYVVFSYRALTLYLQFLFKFVLFDS